MPTTSTDELSFHDLGFQEKVVQVFQHLLIALKFLRGWRVLWQLVEA